MSKRHNILTLISLFIVGFLCSSCIMEQQRDEDIMPEGGAIRVQARLAKTLSSRAYQEEGVVESGQYFLSYPQSGNNQYVVGTVTFGIESSPGMGIAKSSQNTELKWSDVGNSPTTFMLDNVQPSPDNDTDSPTTVGFNENYNPFVADVFDNVDGTNDLLWGSVSVSRDTRTLAFDLHHNMSRVIVQVMIQHMEGTDDPIDLEGASVKITNLYPGPVSYNRLDGNFDLGDQERMKDIMIVDPTKGEKHNWTSVDEDTDNTTYISPDIILPPQSLLEDVNRPKLVITLANGTEYVGILPHAMLVAASNSPTEDLVYPVNLAFLKEHILTIRTVITETPPELEFMPVYVVDWVDKGEFELESHQSGIYTPEEFYKLIGYYEINNEYQLVRYGYETTIDGSSGPIWIFNFFSGVTLEYNEIFNKMHPATETAKGKTKDFSFSFNNYPVFVKNGDADTAVQVNSAQLSAIVKGTLTWDAIKKQ